MQAFVQKYGNTVLSAPTGTGFNRVAWIMPFAVFAASSETFSRKNINQGIDESFATYKAVCDAARATGLRVRGYLSTAFGCPYEGPISPEIVADLTARLVDLGVFEVAVSDTIGIAHPGQVPRVLEAVLARVGVSEVAAAGQPSRRAGVIDASARCLGGGAIGAGGRFCWGLGSAQLRPRCKRDSVMALSRRRCDGLSEPRQTDTTLAEMRRLGL